VFWKEIFDLNHIIILAIYGQVFFVLGLAIFLQSRRHSRLKLARDLRWLALFGVLHGMYEWGLVFIPIQAEYLPPIFISVLLMAHVFVLAASFAALLIFGYVLVDRPRPGLRWLVIGLLAGWFSLALFVHLAGYDGPTRVTLLTIAARYFLALPGGLLAAWRLYRQAQTPLFAAEKARFGRMLRWAAWSLLAYTVVAGLIVVSAPFFPANLLNRANLLAWVGIPVEVFRSLAGLMLTISIIRALELFETEVDQLIEAMEVDAIQATERDRIGQEIHDGVMQSAYSVGLILDSMTHHIDNPLANQRLTQAQQVLEQVILGLRRYMTSLRIRPPAGSLRDELTALTSETRFRSLVDICLEVSDISLDPSRVGHVVGLVQEALSNVVRHAGASQVIIRVVQRGDELNLTIEDDGKGFVPTQVTAGHGLLTMRNHAQLLGGQLAIAAMPDKGTTVKVTWQQDERMHETRLRTESAGSNG
jgi:signal transduction histidine kinase